MNKPYWTEEEDFRSYFWRLFTICFIGLLLIASISFVLDPYGIYPWAPSLSGINRLKPSLSRYQSNVKLTQALRIEPDVLIFGNSRAEIGFDPEAKVFLERGLSVYNLAIPGTTLSTAHSQLRYLLKKKLAPKIAIIGLDYVDFLPNEGGAASSQSVEPTEDNSIDGMFWKFDSLLSIQSMKDIFRLLKVQRARYPSILSPRGFNPLQEYIPIAKEEGYYRLFRQRAEENVKTYRKKSRISFRERDFHELKKMVNLAVDAQMEVVLIIYPYHAQIPFLFDAVGLTLSFQLWKERVILELDEPKQRGKLRFFDFSDYTIYTCETVPGKDDRDSQTKWYWELGHFKKELGDKVLETVFSTPIEQVRENWFNPFSLTQATGFVQENGLKGIIDRESCLNRVGRHYIESIQ